MRILTCMSVAAFALASIAVTSQPPAPKASAVENMAVVRTLPMGWNSWNYFGRNVTEQDVKSAAAAMASNGMRDAGYVYVNIDDGWQGTRNADGMLGANSKFPDMKELARFSVEPVAAGGGRPCLISDKGGAKRTGCETPAKFIAASLASRPLASFQIEPVAPIVGLSADPDIPDASEGAFARN